METDRWPAERLRGLQERLLRRLLTHAAQASPWYREKLRDAPDLTTFKLDDLQRLPILERTDLQDHLDEIAGPARLAADVRPATSSGSSGTPVRLYHSQEYSDWTSAGFDRGYLMCEQFQFGQPRAFFWGSDIDSRTHRGPLGTLRDLAVNQLWFDAFTLRRAGLAEAVRRLRAFRPTLVVGYVSILTEVAAALDRPVDGLAGIVASAETFTPPERSRITKAFGAQTFDRYGTREVGIIAHECEAHDGLHLAMENNLVEVVDADGRPLADPAGEGEILVTNLRNLATPLIRYRLGDVGRLAVGDCPCGRGSNRLASVLGRTSDLIVSPRGILLHALFFMRIFDNTPVYRFRVDQETPTRLRVRVVPMSQYTDDVRRRVTSLILEHGDRGFEVVWEVVDDLPRSPSGKYRFTESHLNKERT
jgi:phenylacetate-CoA ligase